MNKPPFDPSKPFKVVGGKPPFDPSKPFRETETEQPGMLSTLAKGASQALDRYGESQKYSPQDWMNRADRAVRSGANKAGEFVAEEAGRAGLNPYAAAGMGTFMQMTPDIIEAAAAPGSTIEGPKKLLRPISRPMAQRSLGLTKRFLNTPFARGKAAQSADIALDQKVIPFSGNPEVAMQRAVDLQERSGQALGSMREAAGSNPIDPVFDSLEAARQRATGGMKGGAWDTVHRKFDEAQETLMGLLNDGPDVALAKVEQAKKLLSKTVNWIADNVSQETAKQISGSIESGVESIMRSKGIDMTAYAAQKGIYGASKTMQKGLANEVAAQAGNNAVSLPTMVMGAGQLATGNPTAAAATVGLVEALRRRGSGLGARVIDDIPRQLTSVREPIRATFPVQSFLNSRNPSGELSNPKNSPKKPFKSLFRVGIEKPEERGKNAANRGQNYVPNPYNQRNEQGNQNNYNRDIKSRSNQVTPKKLLGQREAKIPTREILLDYLRKARGDKDKARKMAIADGFDISKRGDK